MARILICDDAEFMRMTIRDALESAGHQIVGEAKDGTDAVEKYKKLKPDIVTMDLLMKIPGQGAIKEITAHDPKAKIIVISVLNDQEGEVIEAVRFGASGLVTKPIKRETLISEVDRVFKLER